MDIPALGRARARVVPYHLQLTSDWSVDWMEGKQARAMREKSNAMGKQEKSGGSDKKAVESKLLLETGASAKEGASLRHFAVMGDATMDTGGESAALLQIQSCSKAPGISNLYSNSYFGYKSTI